VSHSAPDLLRPDFRVIAELIAPASRVLDLGCGTGELLEWLVAHRQIHAQGVDISPDNIIACVAKGLSVMQDDIDVRLEGYSDKSFDYVVLSQTLQVVHDAPLVLAEMLRVGRRAIVSIPNFAYWRLRLQLLFKGAKPKNAYYPNEWYGPTRVHPVTIRDFLNFCTDRHVRIVDEVYLSPAYGRARGLRRHFANLLCPVGVFVIADGE
jgi:methionine biosynthesis protein MetW